MYANRRTNRSAQIIESAAELLRPSAEQWAPRTQYVLWTLRNHAWHKTAEKNLRSNAVL